MLVALAIVTGCGGDSEPARSPLTSIAPNSSEGPTTTTPPTSTASDASADEFAECGDVPVTMVQTATFDFDGDGTDDRVVDVVCETSTAGAPHLLVAFVGNGRDVLVNVCEPGAPTCRQEIKDDQVVGDTNLSVDDEGRILFRGRGYSPGAALCCPDLDVRKTFRWNRTHFVEETQ